MATLQHTCHRRLFVSLKTLEDSLSLLWGDREMLVAAESSWCCPLCTARHSLTPASCAVACRVLAGSRTGCAVLCPRSFRQRGLCGKSL